MRATRTQTFIAILKAVVRPELTCFSAVYFTTSLSVRLCFDLSGGFFAHLRPLSLDLLTRCVQYLTVLFLVQYTPVHPYNSKITTNAGDKTVVIFSLFFFPFSNVIEAPIPTRPRLELMHYRHTFYRILVRTLLF